MRCHLRRLGRFINVSERWKERGYTCKYTQATYIQLQLQIQLVKGRNKDDTSANTHKPLTYKYNYKKLQKNTNTISKRWKEREYTYKYTLPIFSHTNTITNYKLQIQLAKGGKKEDTTANTHNPRLNIQTNTTTTLHSYIGNLYQTRHLRI